jgi:ketosteroid isomerase-like protein
MTDDERAIRDLVATWMKASEASDVQTVLSLMADDVSFMVPGREPFGKDAFRDGDWAYIRNYLEITINQPYSALCPKTHCVASKSPSVPAIGGYRSECRPQDTLAQARRPVGTACDRCALRKFYVAPPQIPEDEWQQPTAAAQYPCGLCMVFPGTPSD